MLPPISATPIEKQYREWAKLLQHLPLLCGVGWCLFLALFPPVLRTTPAHPCHFRIISPSGFQILIIFQVSLDENVRTDYFF